MRAFIGIDLSCEIKSKLENVALELQKGFGKGNWRKQASYHLTLKFLGEVSSEQVDWIKKNLEPIINASKPFEFTLSEIGSFGEKEGKVNVIWAGIDTEDAALSELQNQISQTIIAIGIMEDPRGFNPHITLAQSVKKTSPIFEKTMLPPIKMVVDKVTFFESVPTEHGRKYVPLFHWNIGKP